MSAARNSEDGFTLVEVLISLFIFAIISAGTLGAMFQTFAAKDRLNLATEQLADVATFRAIIRADMDALTLRPARDGLGGMERTLLTTDGDALLQFTRLGRSNPVGAKRGQAQRVQYIFRNNQFIRETLTHENPDQLDGWRGRVLMDNIDNAEVFYVTRGQSDYIELENWVIPNDGRAPSLSRTGAVKLTLVQNGTETSHLFEIGQ